jgi:hypothetical protein
MEKQWLLASEILTKTHISLALFGFDIVEEDISYLCNGLTRKTFPKTGQWKSPSVRWVRAGLIVWDFLLFTSSVEMTEGQVVLLTRDEERWRVQLTCRVLEAHVQTRMELGDLIYSDVQSYSRVCGRAVLALEKIEVFQEEE